MTHQLDHLGLDVRPLAGHIGAEIHGVDLSADLDDATIAELRSALLRWKVIFFREQFIGHAEQVAFGRRFGDLTPGHPHDDAPDGYPEIFVVDRRRFEARIGKTKYDNAWHSDVTPVINPPFGSILRADVVPTYGGDTMWTNLVAAYEGLSTPLQELADSLRAVHRYRVPEGLEGVASEYKARIDANPLVTEHPVVRVHPETGEKALYVNPVFTSHVVGFSPRESQRVLELFYEEIARPEYTARFRWEPGSIAFWDNRATAHLAPRDIEHLDFDRRLYRVTLVGDVPVGPDGRPSRSLEGGTFAAA
jgi:alpha-ketoglutarate-dependent taurine dioxygenase